ncbi:adenylate/guanylate cyclase domain-containing protein [Gaetbulibacter aquiaggeris]|uniref:Adenylate/guanylate cyclase domain-containing protein n=1 Tax=Gaetbulibacter aquiaggeris TaxID=1735373 RepID=A0ABW7MSL5_9FLAO
MMFKLSFQDIFPLKAYLLIGFFCLVSNTSFSQKKSLLDSLESVYRMGGYDEKDQLIILNELSINHSDPQKKLQYSAELIQKAKLLDSTQYLFIGLINKGHALRFKGDYTQALESFFDAASIAAKNNNNREIGLVNITIADVYSEMKNHKNAVSYYKNGIDLLKKEHDTSNFANGLFNLGDEYLSNKEYDLAIEHFMEAGLLFRKIKSNDINLGEIGEAYVLGNMGIIYAEQGKDDLAEANINEAIGMMEKHELYSPISEYLTYMSDIYLNKNDWKSAFNYSKRSLDIATKYGLKEQISQANLQISRLFEKSGSFKEALTYFKKYQVYKDSIANIQNVLKIGDLRTDFEISKKQTEVNLKQSEVNLLNQQKKNQRIVMIATAIALFLIVLLAFGLYRRNKFISRTKLIIEKEKNRSDNLLLNILPEETAQELKTSGKVEAKRFESVSVLFTDFKDFTKYSESLAPEKLVKSIDFYFSRFDEIIEKYELEKIKIVGDSFMCAGGLPFPTEDHALKITLAAFEMLQFVEDTKQNDDSDIVHFDVRIGINTGPVVAGVVGTKKFAYDIWGDTVNVASRMEASSREGKINITENTYLLIKDYFKCKYRGEIEVKNKGVMKMYFVNSIKDRTIASMKF